MSSSLPEGGRIDFKISDVLRAYGADTINELEATTGMSLAEASAAILMQDTINLMYYRQPWATGTRATDDTYARPNKPVAHEAGAYRAWRLWVLPPGTLDLKAITRPHIWLPGENVVDDPLIRMKGQRMGFYGLLRLPELARQEATYWGTARSGSGWDGHCCVIGSTINHGYVDVWTLGLRAEKATPEYLVLSENEDHNIRLLSVAERYGMKLATLEEAQQMETGLINYSKEIS